jgi:hypothetical protein
MAQRSIRQILVFLLAVLVTAGLSLSVVQAAMPMPQPTQASMMAGMDKSSGNGCKQCGDMAGGKAMVCSPVCVSPLATTPHTFSPPPMLLATPLGGSENLLTGRTLAPETGPPRPFAFI